MLQAHTSSSDKTSTSPRRVSAGETLQNLRARFTTRQLVAAAAGAIVLIVVLVVVILAQRSGSGTPADAGLKRTADSMLVKLNSPPPILPVQDSSLSSFQAWFYDFRPVFQKLAPHLGRQYAQIQAVDPTPFPPQSPPMLRSSNTLAFFPDTATYNSVIKTGKPAYTTIHQGSIGYRMYLAPLTVPGVLKPSGSYAILEVIQKL